MYDNSIKEVDIWMESFEYYRSEAERYSFNAYQRQQSEIAIETAREKATYFQREANYWLTQLEENKQLQGV